MSLLSAAALSEPVLTFLTATKVLCCSGALLAAVPLQGSPSQSFLPKKKKKKQALNMVTEPVKHTTSVWPFCTDAALALHRW